MGYCMYRHCASSIVAATREGLPPTHKVLAIFDVFAAHRTDTCLKKLSENNIVSFNQLTYVIANLS